MSGASPTGTIKQFTIYLRSSFWFVPACLMLAAVALALALVGIDAQVNERLSARWPQMFGGGKDGSRDMLSAIASSMITVAGVVFSITIVALAQASTQYTPRVLRNFMRDRLNQTVLGVFVGVFTYCLIVLRTISDSDDGALVPAVAVAVGLVLAIIAIGFLIVFIHHISATIQAGEIVRTIALETRDAVHRLFPDDVGTQARQPDATHAIQAVDRWQPVLSSRTGYIQSVDPESLLGFAIRHDTIVRMEVGIGEFITDRRLIASLAMREAPAADLVREFDGLYAVDTYRTADQDPEFGFGQLVDIALKALSPAINDTTTAVTCIDYLSGLLEQVAHRDVESPCRSEGSRLRVIARGPTFAQLADLSFGQILENATGNTVVLMRLLRMAEEVAASTTLPERRDVLALRVEVIGEVAMGSAKSSHARDMLSGQITRARAACA